MATPNQQTDDAAKMQALANGTSTPTQTQAPAATGTSGQNDDAARFLAVLNGTAPQPSASSPQAGSTTQPTTWERIKDFASEAFNPWDERNLHPKEVSAGAINRGAAFDPQTQELYDPAKHSSLVRGAEKGLTETLSGTSQLAGKAVDKLGLRHAEGNQPRGILGEAPATPAETTPQGVAEHIGYLGENLMEFITGEEALKGLSLAEKFGLATKIAKLAESHPSIAKLIGLGLRASRTGTVSAAQAAVHGGDAGDVATAGGTGFATSVASEGLGELSRLARPGTKTIAGETLETAPKWKGVSSAANLAKQNTPAAQRAVGNIARDSAEKIVQKFGQHAPETITSFRDAAQSIQEAAQPVFKTLDKVSDGQFQVARNEMDRAAKVMRRATSMKDLTEAEQAYNAASAKIDKIFQDAGDQVSPTDLQNAKSAWRSMKTLEKIHTKIDAAYNMPQNAAEISGAERTLQLQKLQGRLNAAFKALPKADLENVLGAEGTKNLYELSALGAEPIKAQSLAEIARQIGTHLSSGGLGAGAGALLGHALPGGAIGIGIHLLYSHPEAGSMVVKALAKGTRPEVVVPAVLQLLQSQRTAQ